MTGQPIKIFGEHGTIRDYIYVSDLASGIACALINGRLSETYNLGSGIGLSNSDVIGMLTPMIETLGFAVQVERQPERVFDVKTNILDSAKLQSHTGWRPQVGFEEGLRLAFEWTVDFCAKKCQS